MSDIHILQAQLAGLTQLATRAPAAWRKAYPDSTYQVVHPENYLDFICHDLERQRHDPWPDNQGEPE